MDKSVINEIEVLIEELELNCNINGFADNIKVDWYYISRYQKLSENFIREFAK